MSGGTGYGQRRRRGGLGLWQRICASKLAPATASKMSSVVLFFACCPSTQVVSE